MAQSYDYNLDLHSELIMDEYRENLPVFEKMLEVVTLQVKSILESNHVQITNIGARVKQEKSLAGKLVRKGYKYQTLNDLTDILGIRIITLFSDDVDRVASFMERLFDIDWRESIDKRKMHDLNSFGYNSLHYICRIPKELFYDARYPDLNNFRFEIQMRSTLQHAWAEMEHDIGYKTIIDTPGEYQRMFSRLAGLLELADEEFSRIRVSLAEYRRRMEQLIKAGQLSEVPLDGETFARYTSTGAFNKLNRRIASINQAELQEMSYEPFLPLLKEQGMQNLQDIEDLINQHGEDAYKLAINQLAVTDLDIIATTIGLQNLMIVATLKNGGGIAGIKHIYDAINGKSNHNEALASMIYHEALKLQFMMDQKETKNK